MGQVVDKSKVPQTRSNRCSLKRSKCPRKGTPQPPGTDFQHFTVVSIELQHGGFTGTTTTCVTLDVQPEALPKRP